ncbi:MAG TPA: translation elongation factor Ts [Candidatus Magasanikbacteria bacterium]|nr:translation elongation factor Ts [Candidatus Magasanikbacteria bacterium]
MSITANDIAKLREQTGAGMMDCKKALEEANGDMDAAAEILRKKGIVKAAKRGDKIAAEGLVAVKTQGNIGVVLEVNSETDFVAKNDDFKKMVDEIADFLLVKKPSSLEDALNGTIGNITLNEFISNAVAKIGEKISFRRFAILEKGDKDVFGPYLHMGGKIAVLSMLKNTDDEALARDISMQAAAANPKFLNREMVDVETLNKEKEIYAEQLRAQGKPENIIENILKGKMDKFYSEVCLLEQPFIKDEEKSITAYLAGKGTDIKVETFVRYELGEGLAKKTNDFAAEVAEQMGQ